MRTALSRLLHRRPVSLSLLLPRWRTTGPSLDACQDLHDEIGTLTASFYECQRQLASVQYTAKVNPHSARVQERANRTKTDLERIHDQFQMLMQRAAHKSVTGAEIVFNGYRQLFQARTWHYNVLMDALVRYSPGQCDSLLRRMDHDGIEPDVDFFNLWLGSLSKTRANLDEMRRVLDEMKCRSIDADRYTHSTVLEILAQHRQIDLVVETLDAMVAGSISPTPAALARVLMLFGEVGDYARGDVVRDSLLSGSADASYSLAIYTAIMRYTIKRGQLDLAESVWDEMDLKETRPAPDVFDLYISVLFDDGQREHSLSWPERRNRLQRLLSRAAKAFVRLTLRPVLPFLPQLIENYVGDNDVLTLLFQAVAQSNFPAKLNVQASFCDWFEKTGNLETMKVVVDTMEKVGMSAQSLGHAAVQRCAVARPKLCLGLIRYLVERGIPVYRESLVSITFSAATRIDLDTCDAVRQIMTNLGMTPTAPLLNAHLNTAIQANGVNRIDELLDEMRQHGYKLQPENAQYMLVRRSSCGDYDTCQRLFEMLKCDGTRVPSALEFDSMVAVTVRHGDPFAALGLMREMCLAGHAPSYPLLHEVIDCFVTRGLLDDAQHLVESLPRGRLADFCATCSKLLTLLAKRGELDRCERVCILIEEAGGFPSVSAMNAMIAAFRKVGMVETAHELHTLVVERQRVRKGAPSFEVRNQ